MSRRSSPTTRLAARGERVVNRPYSRPRTVVVAQASVDQHRLSPDPPGHGRRATDGPSVESTPHPHHLAYFFLLGPEEFVQCAYRTFLGRAATTEEISSRLRELQTGLDRGQILLGIQGSEEGRRNGAVLQGLQAYGTALRLARIPIIGHVLALPFKYLAIPPPALIEASSAIVTRRFHGLERTLAESRSIDQDKLQELASNMVSFEQQQRGLMSTLADREDVEALRHQFAGLEEQLRSVADRAWQHGTTAERSAHSPTGRDPQSSFAPPPGIDVDAYYAQFEDHFRGTSEEIRERLRAYLPILDGDSIRELNAPALDLGCGRGEWLGLMREYGIEARGVDLNRVMIDRCRAAGLDVVEVDAGRYLSSLADESVSVLSGFHIVEHLPFHDALALLDQALRVLKPGGMLILETPNPENLLVGACYFYFDPTHRNPLPPEALRFAVSARGFERVEILRLQPPVLGPDESMEGLPVFVANAFLAGQDYAIIGRKPAGTRDDAPPSSMPQTLAADS